MTEANMIDPASEVARRIHSALRQAFADRVVSVTDRDGEIWLESDATCGEVAAVLVKAGFSIRPEGAAKRSAAMQPSTETTFDDEAPCGRSVIVMNTRPLSARGTLLPLNPFLHRDEAERLALGTYAGQAHFAGTGPRARSCGACALWDGLPTAKKARCRMFEKLTGREGPKVPRHAASCRYFAAKEG
jgi:hypothetical protein